MKKIICLLSLIVFCAGNVYAFYENTIELEDSDYMIETTGSIEVPTLNARAAILYDATYGRILYEKNSKQKRANASTTKMITALVAYENGNLDDEVIVSKKAAGTGGSSINLRAGDKLSLDGLIKGLLVHSGNDAAVAIAEHIAGSIENFSTLMNEKAQEIGAVDTSFITPHGLDSDNHYSTAYDLVLIAEELLKIPYLANIVSQKSVDILVNGQTRVIGTTNEMLSVYTGVNGVKTGFTGNAGRCIITSAIRNDRRLISVVLGCDTKKHRTNDSIKLLNYGFEVFKTKNLGDFIRKTICINVEKSEGNIYTLTKDVEFLYPLKENEEDKITVKYSINDNLIAPVHKGEKLAIAEIYLAGDKIHEVVYFLTETIERKGWKSYFMQIIKNNSYCLNINF